MRWSMTSSVPSACSMTYLADEVDAVVYGIRTATSYVPVAGRSGVQVAVAPTFDENRVIPPLRPRIPLFTHVPVSTWRGGPSSLSTTTSMMTVIVVGWLTASLPFASRAQARTVTSAGGVTSESSSRVAEKVSPD